MDREHGATGGPPVEPHVLPDAAYIARTSTLNVLVPRWGAVIVDYALFLVLTMVLGRLLERNPWVIVALAAVAYFTILEGRWGFTLGKLSTKIRVVDRSGDPPGYRKAFIRMLLRFVEVNPVLAGGVPAAIISSLSKTRQRLGDMLAGTYVLHVDDVKKLRELRK